MPRYHYKAVDEKGDIYKGTLTAFDGQDVETRLQKKGLTLISEKKKKEGLLSGLLGSGSIKPRMLIEFYYRLSQSQELGIPIIDTLDDSSMLTPNKPLRKISQEIKVALESGKTLYEAMGQFPGLFKRLDLGLIRMGEESGNLPSCIKDLASFMEWKEETRSAIKRATIYPCFIFLVILAVIGVWIGYVLPQMADVLKDMGMTLPAMTRMVLSTSLFVQSYWILILGAFFILFILMYLFQKTQRGGIIFHKFLLKIPAIGEVIANITYARVSHYFATMHEAGITLKNIFEILLDGVLGNLYIEDRLRFAFDDIQKGQSIAESFEASKGFPPLLLGAIKNGETTGTIGESFNRLGDYYDHEVKRSVEVMVSSFEPLTILILGGVFGIIVLSILLPLYDVIGQMGKAY
ncbi:MAG: type II secretion system F family protein [Deltaproteobacteria bacterium]|nr:type II secretion system F family protein [Deltaproteobacteria bacterium]